MRMQTLFRKEIELHNPYNQSDILLTQSRMIWLYWIGCLIGIITLIICHIVS